MAPKSGQSVVVVDARGSYSERPNVPASIS
jgi:hypothetical protein